MRIRIILTIVVLFFMVGFAWAGIFRKDQDFHAIKGFGGITVVDGRPMVGEDGRRHIVPLGTQFRLNDGPYFTYDPEGKTPAIGTSFTTELDAPWHFDTNTIGNLPRGSGSYDKRYTLITETRVRAGSGPLKGWYLGVDRVTLKAQDEHATNDSEPTKGQPRSWPLVLVKEPADALVFVHQVSGVYGPAR